MAKQVEAIRVALGQPLIQEFHDRGASCALLVDAEWSLFAKPFALLGVWIGRPRRWASSSERKASSRPST